MHDANSPGPLAIQSVLCNRKWACVVSAICGEWQRDTHVDDKAMQPTTSATNHLQPQHTHHWSCMLHHTPQSTHTIVHTCTWLDGGGETGLPHSDDQHTMVSWQPHTSPIPLWCSTPSSNTSLLPSSWWCTGNTHATLCTANGLESVVLCMPGVAIPLTFSVSPIHIREYKFAMCAQRRRTERKLENTRAACTHSLDVALGVSERGI